MSSVGQIYYRAKTAQPNAKTIEMAQPFGYCSSLAKPLSLAFTSHMTATTYYLWAWEIVYCIIIVPLLRLRQQK